MDVLVISDQALTVLATRAVFRRHAQVGEVADANHLAEAIRMLRRQRFGLIVLDLDTHGVRPICTTALLRQHWPDVPLAVLSSRDCDATIVRAVSLGVSGYVLKTADTPTLHAAFAQLLAGRLYVPEFTLPTNESATG